MAVEVIAELAQGYEGRPALADLLVSAALAAGAHAVKLQLVLADELATPSHEKYDWYRQLNMSDEVWAGLADKAHAAGSRFYLDVFGLQSLEMAKELGADGVKIHSSDFHNDDLVAAALDGFETVLVSIGGVHVEELEAFLGRHERSSSPSVRFMYGFQAYPTDIADNNLRRFQSLRERFGQLRFGFMDHSPGASAAALHVPLMAVALGATTIEKHMTVAHNTELVDHWSALTPDELQGFNELIDSLEPALGSASPQLSAAEEVYRKQALKVVVASRPLAAGDLVSRADVDLKRTAGASGLVRVDDALGRTLAHSIAEGEPLTEADLS